MREILKIIATQKTAVSSNDQNVLGNAKNLAKDMVLLVRCNLRESGLKEKIGRFWRNVMRIANIGALLRAHIMTAASNCFVMEDYVSP